MAQISKQGMFDANVCVRNRNAWTAEQIKPYLGRWVAWNLDGTHIVASHTDPLEVVRAVSELGLTGEEVLLEFLPSEEEVGGLP